MHERRHYASCEIKLQEATGSQHIFQHGTESKESVHVNEDVKEHVVRKDRRDECPDSSVFHAVPAHEKICDHELRRYKPHEENDDVNFDDGDDSSGAIESHWSSHSP